MKIEMSKLEQLRASDAGLLRGMGRQVQDLEVRVGPGLGVGSPSPAPPPPPAGLLEPALPGPRSEGKGRVCSGAIGALESRPPPLF